MESSSSSDPETAADAFLDDGCHVADIIRARDWTAHPLGPPATWLASCRVAFSLVLNAPAPMILAWGPQRHLLYNDAARPLLGPAAMGAPLEEIWPELKDQPLIAGALAGQPQGMIGLPGKPDSPWTLALSRVLDAEGAPAGLLIAATATAPPAPEPSAARALGDLGGELVELARINQRLERQIADQTTAHDQMWRNSRDLLLIMSPDGAFHSVSPSVEQILGWTPEDMIGQSVYDFVLPEHQTQTTEGLDGLRRGVSRVSENRYRHKDGGFRWLSWVATAEAGLIYATGRHITEEKLAAAKLAAAQEALRQSQKMDAIGQLTGGIAHDFNNLLTPIIGSMDLARRELAHDSRLAKIMAAGIQAADRARTLVSRLLAFSRSQTLDPKPVDLARLLLDMADLIRRSIGPEILVRFDLPSTLPPVYVDANQLDMAILNITVNARDAMPSGGTLTFLAREVQDAPDTPPQLIELAITDSGSGMDAETAARAIEPFFTTKGAGKGTGLGLSMVHGLMGQLGGSMAIRSAFGRGTTIVLRMPAAQTQAAAVEPPATPNRAATPDGRKILVVDDEALVLTMTADMLDEEGYSVTEAQSGVEALMLMDSGYVPDMLITDESMPGMRGHQLARIFTERFGPRPVLIATGYAIARDFGFPTINKPFTAAELAHRIRDLQQ